MNGASQSSLWRTAFNTPKNDNFKDQRIRLMQSLERIRDNVSQLLSFIPADCKHLTVHDISHLDALWELASIIAGTSFVLNPAEVYVLGAAIYLHDSGLSSASYPNGLNGLKLTTEWKDICAATLREDKIEPSAEMLVKPPDKLFPAILFGVLRALHAKQAERMAIDPWKSKGSEIYIIEDLEFRQSFGSSIGRIAHSHNWDIERVALDLSANIGTSTALPIEWSVNEIKLACVLRCADAAHIDRRRAPTVRYAALHPIGFSEIHWNSQNKINKLYVDGNSLVYNAGQSFKASEADAWWLIYDMIEIIDNEVRSSNSLLEEFRFGQLHVQRVAGAGSPRALSKFVRPDGWRPVSAEVKVSDPIHLALTLGGRSLYGSDVLAPVRELLQNCADAIRARRQLENRDPDWGLIRVSIEEAESAGACWLHIDDNGIGMTERVLAGPLIDFGSSIWNSAILREEFPGLQSKTLAPIGKFGIGFFSVFDLASQVKVTSKRYDSGIADAKTLEFKTLTLRPLIREADAKELPTDFSTRVSLRIEERSRIVGLYKNHDDRYFMRRSKSEVTIASAILRLVAMLDIRLEFADKITGASFEHGSKIYDTSSDVFIDELYCDISDRGRDLLKTAHNKMLQTIKMDGTIYGRACLLLTQNSSIEELRSLRAKVSVGGFVYSSANGIDVPSIGVFEGTTDQAARRHAVISAPPEVLAAWATEQAKKIERSKLLKDDVMRLAETIVHLGGDPGDMHYCLTSKGLISYEAAKNFAKERDDVRLPLSIDYQQNFQTRSYSKLDAIFFDLSLLEGVFILREASNDILEPDFARLVARSGRREVTWEAFRKDSGSLSVFIKMIEELWGTRPRVFIEGYQIFSSRVHSSPSPQWVLLLKRSS